MTFKYTIQAPDRKKVTTNWGWQESKKAFRRAPLPIKAVFWFAVLLSLLNVFALFSSSEWAANYSYLAGPISHYYGMFYVQVYWMAASGIGSKAKWFGVAILVLHIGMYALINLFDHPTTMYLLSSWWPLQFVLLIVVFGMPLFLHSVSAYLAEYDQEIAFRKAEKMKRYAQLPKPRM